MVGNPRYRKGVCRQRSSRPIRQPFATRPGGDTSCASGKDLNCTWVGDEDRNYEEKKKTNLTHVSSGQFSVPLSEVRLLAPLADQGGQSRSGS